MSEVVYVSETTLRERHGRSGGRYHLRPDCGALLHAIPATMAALRRLQPCAKCTSAAAMRRDRRMRETTAPKATSPAGR